jgi:hypothetical protein
MARIQGFSDERESFTYSPDPIMPTPEQVWQAIEAAVAHDTAMLEARYEKRLEFSEARKAYLAARKAIVAALQRKVVKTTLEIYYEAYKRSCLKLFHLGLTRRSDRQLSAEWSAIKKQLDARS